MFKKILVILGVILLTIIVLFGIFLYMLMSGEGLFSDMCANEIFSEIESPNKKHKVVIFERSCGATTGFSTQASIISANENLENKSGNLFVLDGHPDYIALSAKWENDKALIIKSDKVSPYKQENAYGDISVVYKFKSRTQ